MAWRAVRGLDGAAPEARVASTGRSPPPPTPGHRATTPSELAAAAETDALYARTAERLAERLAPSPRRPAAPTRVGAMRLGDYLVTRTVELVVHTDDLKPRAGLDIPYDRQALATCTRLLADALAVKAPGGSTEVRIPPFAVVQCVEGPRHTRGTPPTSWRPTR